MASKDISTVDYTDSFNTFFVKDIDDIRQVNKDNVKNVLGIGVVTGAIAEADSTLTLTDSIDKPFELHLYGKSTQDGTPTPDNPIEIVNVENPTLTINNGADVSQTQQFDYELRGIEDVKDELIVYADGSGKLIQRCAKTSKLSNKWTTNNSKKSRWKFDANAKTDGSNATIKNILCSHCEANMANTVGTAGCKQGISVDLAGAVALYLENMSAISDLSVAQQYINDNNIYVIYELATPIITELTVEQMKSYYPVTNIYTDQSAGIKAVYTADIKGYIDRKFDELATALVAQTSEQ